MPVTRPPARLLLTVLLALGAWLGTAGVAQAHTGLQGSTPPEGSTLTEPPTAVTLAFSSTVRGPEVTVTGPDGANVTTAAATADGSSVTVPVALTAPGPHTVTWAATSADGHRLEGSWVFTSAVPTPPATTPAPTTPLPTTPLPTTPPPMTAAPSTAAPSTAAPTTPAPTTPAPGTSVDPAEAATTTDDDVSGVTVAVVLVVLLAAGAGTGLWLRRRRTG